MSERFDAIRRIARIVKHNLNKSPMGIAVLIYDSEIQEIRAKALKEEVKNVGEAEED